MSDSNRINRIGVAEFYDIDTSSKKSIHSRIIHNSTFLNGEFFFFTLFVKSYQQLRNIYYCIKKIMLRYRYNTRSFIFLRRRIINLYIYRNAYLIVRVRFKITSFCTTKRINKILWIGNLSEKQSWNKYELRTGSPETIKSI